MSSHLHTNEVSIILLLCLFISIQIKYPPVLSRHLRTNEAFFHFFNLFVILCTNRLCKKFFASKILRRETAFQKSSVYWPECDKTSFESVNFKISLPTRWERPSVGCLAEKLVLLGLRWSEFETFRVEIWNLAQCAERWFLGLPCVFFSVRPPYFCAPSPSSPRGDAFFVFSPNAGNLCEKPPTDLIW